MPLTLRCRARARHLQVEPARPDTAWQPFAGDDSLRRTGKGRSIGVSEERLSFKEMCTKFGVTPRTLRHYEYIELLRPERDGRTRHYGPREVARMTLILRGRRFGFSLEQIRQWLELYNADPEGQVQREAWLEMADRQLDELEERRSDLTAAIEELRALRAATAGETG